MKPLSVDHRVHQIQAIGARVTVIRAGDRVVLIDTGMKGSLNSISAGLEALGLSLGQVDLVVITHHHPDHVGSLDKVVEATCAGVAAHHLEAGGVEGQDPAPSPFRNPILANVTRPILATLYGTQVAVDHLLDDGAYLPVEEEIRVVHTPGHTTGSICLYVPSSRLVIVGDALQYRFRRLRPPAAPVTQDPQQALESLRKILQCDFETICFGHFPPLVGSGREALEGLIERVSPS